MSVATIAVVIMVVATVAVVVFTAAITIVVVMMMFTAMAVVAMAVLVLFFVLVGNFLQILNGHIIKIIVGIAAADELGHPVEIAHMAAAIINPLFGVDIHLQQFGRAFGKEFHFVGHGRHKHTFARMDGYDIIQRLHRCNTFYTEIHHKRVER